MLIIFNVRTYHLKKRQICYSNMIEGDFWVNPCVVEVYAFPFIIYSLKNKTTTNHLEFTIELYFNFDTNIYSYQ